jgi:hypothetical protein
MVILSLSAVAPVFAIAKIDSIIDFQEISDMGDILVCRETWTPKIRCQFRQHIYAQLLCSQIPKVQKILTS